MASAMDGFGDMPIHMDILWTITGSMAWRLVIKAFNHNMPYDQFVTWQLEAIYYRMLQKSKDGHHLTGFILKMQKAVSSMKSFGSNM